MFDILQHIKKIQKEYLIWICMFLLIIPKINIVQLSSYSGSGLRIDDFILLAISCFFILVAVYKQSTIFKRVEFFFFIFIGISLISLIANSIYQRGSILYVIRLFEYWIFFYVGSFVTDRLRFRQFLTVIIYLNGLVIILQYYGIIGGYANGIYVANLTRPSGLTNGAYEAPMFIAIAFLFAISLYKKNSKQLLIHYFFSNLFIFMTGARIPFLAINFLFLGHVFFKFNRIKKTFSIFLLITVLLIGFYFGLNANITKNNENVLSRITSVLTLETVDAIKVIYEISPENESGVEGNTLSDAQLKVKTGEAKHDLQDANLQADLSLMVRV
ncbi:MAG: hypothetical protein KJN84_14600, partial [Bacteroidia bacterium]|nr:hypothetical protein [Bacteroidia bacterium]